MNQSIFYSSFFDLCLNLDSKLISNYYTACIFTLWHLKMSVRIICTLPYHPLPPPVRGMAAWLPPWLCSWTLLWSYCQCGWSRRTRPSLTCSCKAKRSGYQATDDGGDTHGLSKAHAAWKRLHRRRQRKGERGKVGAVQCIKWWWEKLKYPNPKPICHFKAISQLLGCSLSTAGSKANTAHRSEQWFHEQMSNLNGIFNKKLLSVTSQPEKVHNITGALCECQKVK